MSVSKKPDEDCEAGFEPIIAADLPMGFQLHKVETVCGESSTVAIRISDGLVRGTVYEWKRQSGEKMGKSSVFADVGSIRILVSADIPKALKQRLLNAFVGANGPFVNRSVPSFVDRGTLTVSSRVQE